MHASRNCATCGCILAQPGVYTILIFERLNISSNNSSNKTLSFMKHGTSVVVCVTKQIAVNKTNRKKISFCNTAKQREKYYILKVSATLEKKKKTLLGSTQPTTCSDNLNFLQHETA